MKYIRLMLAWLLIAAMLIPGFTMAEDIEDAIIETPVIDDFEPVIVAPEIVEPAVIETVAEDIAPIGSVRLDHLAAEYGVAPEKILYLAGVSAEDIELMSAEEFNALRDLLNESFRAEAVDDIPEAEVFTVDADTVPDITGQPVSVTSANGTTATFTVTATGTSLSYQWQYRTTPAGVWQNTGLTGNATATLSVPVIVSRHGYQYHCIVKNSAGTATSEAAMLTVTGSKPVIAVQPVDQTAATGATANFTVIANGSGLSYQWQYRTTPTGTWQNTGLTGNATATLSVSATATRNGYQYRCVVKNSAGNVYSDPATLTIITERFAQIGTNSIDVKMGEITKLAFVAPENGIYHFFTTGEQENTLGYLYNASGETIPTENIGNRNGNFRIHYNLAAGQKVYIGVKHRWSADFRTVTLVVEKDLPFVTGGPYNREFPAGVKVDFSVNATGPNISYQWQYRASASDSWHNASVPGSTTAGINFTTSADLSGYQYRCALTNEFGTTYSNPATLTIITVPTVNVGRNPVYVGENERVKLLFTAPETATYIFSSQGINSTDAELYSMFNTFIIGNSEGSNSNFRIEYFMSAGDSVYLDVRYAWSNYSGTMNVMVESSTDSRLPWLNTSYPFDSRVDENKEAKFTVVANGSDLTYQWQYRTSASGAWNNTNLTGNKTDTLTVPALLSRNGYQYRCAVTNRAGTVYSKHATLMVTPATAAPVITTQPSDRTVSVNETAIFSVAATGTGLTYQWQYRTSATGTWNNTSITGNTTATLSVPALASRNGYQYRCAVKNSVGTVYSNAANLTVNSTPAAALPVITTQPSNRNVSVNETAAFIVAATGTGLSYQWQYRTSTTGTWNNTSIAGNTTATLSVPALASRNGYQYRCAVKNSAGTVYSNAATLTVNSTPSVTLPVITTQPSNRTVSVNETATFTVAATGTGLSYQWQYRTSAAGSWNNTSIAGNTTATLSVPALASRNGYQYRCAVKNSAGTVYSDAATLTVNSTPVAALPVITTQPSDCTVSVNETAAFTVAATGTGLSYQWQYRTSTTGTWNNTSITGNTTATLSVPALASRNGYQYRCAVKNSAGTVYSNAATLTVNSTPAAALPVITTQPSDRTVSVNETATFTVVATGTGLSYQWQYRTSIAGAWNNTTISGNTTATLSVPAIASRNGYQYRCAVKNSAGTVYSNAAALTVNSTPVTAQPVITTQPSDRTVSENEIATFTVVASGSNLTYQWQYRTSAAGAWNNTTLSGNKTATLSVPAIASRHGYQYRCVVTNAAGSATSNAANLSLRTTPSVTLPIIISQPLDRNVPENDTTTFSVLASGVDLMYQWQYRTSTTGAWNNTTMTGNKTATLSVPVIASRNGYQYRCAVKNAAGTVYSDPATLVINVFPTADIGTNYVRVVAGQVTRVLFTAPSAGEYDFYSIGTTDTLGALYGMDGTMIASDDDSGDDSNFLMTYDMTAGQKIYIDVRYLISSIEGTITLVIGKSGEALPVITDQPEDMTGYDGEEVDFMLTAIGTSLSYQWQYRTSPTGTWNNTSLEGCRTSMLTVAAIPTRNGYQYRCVVSNGAGSVYSDVVTLTVETTTAVPEIVRQPESRTVAVNTTVAFTAVANGHDPSYQWQYRTSESGSWSNADFEGNNTTTLRVQAIESRDGYQFRCVISNVAGAVYTDVVTLTIRNIPTVELGNTSVLVASGETARLLFTAPEAGEYVFYSTGNLNADCTIYDMHETLLLYDDNSGEDNNFSITWAMEEGDMIFVDVKYHFTSDSGRINLFIEKRGGSRPVIVYQPMNMSEAEGQQVQFILVATGAELTYQWQYRASESSGWVNETTMEGYNAPTLNVIATADRNGYQYRCRVTNSVGSVYSDTVTLTVAIGSELDILWNTLDVVNGSTARTLFVAPYTGTYAFFTYGNDDTYGYLYTSRTASTPVMEDDDNGDRGNFRIEYDMNAGDSIYIAVEYVDSVDKNTIQLCVDPINRVGPLPVPRITSQPSDMTVREGENAIFTIGGLNVEMYIWQYKTSPENSWIAAPMAGALSDTLIVPANAESNGYQFRCAVSNNYGCVYSETVTLTVRN